LPERIQARIMPFRIGFVAGTLAYSAWVVTSLIKIAVVVLLKQDNSTSSFLMLSL